MDDEKLHFLHISQWILKRGKRKFLTIEMSFSRFRQDEFNLNDQPSSMWPSDADTEAMLAIVEKKAKTSKK